MRIKIQTGRRAPEAALTALERTIRRSLSDSFRVFSQHYDGAKPDTNIFKVGLDNDSGVNEFIPASQILRERAYMSHISQTAYPVAWAEGGNYVIIDEGDNGAVYFWDHEQPEQPTKLAPNFFSFLELLDPFDIKTIRLKPGQVKKAWIDPDFLKKHQKG